MLVSTEVAPTLSAEALAEIFSPFFEWKFLNRSDKRAVLAATVPEIHVADYVVSGIHVNLRCSNEDTPVRAGFVVATQSVYLPINL